MINSGDTITTGAAPESAPADSVQRMVKPHPVGYHTHIATDRGHVATQVTIGRECLGTYWHVRDGYKPTRSNKIYADEQGAKASIVRGALKYHKEIVASLESELVRLND